MTPTVVDLPFPDKPRNLPDWVPWPPGTPETPKDFPTARVVPKKKKKKKELPRGGQKQLPPGDNKEQTNIEDDKVKCTEERKKE